MKNKITKIQKDLKSMKDCDGLIIYFDFYLDQELSQSIDDAIEILEVLKNGK